MSNAKTSRRGKKKAGTPAPDEALATSFSTKGAFTSDVAKMMYGFGDDQTPYKESVDLVEEMMMDYIVEIMHKAIAAGAAKGGKPTAEDLIFLVRKDPLKFARVKELLFMQKELADAKKMLNIDNDLNAAAGAVQDS